MTATMYAPLASTSFSCPSGNVYLSSRYNIIEGVLASDILSLQQQGCIQLNPVPTNLLGQLLQANFNAASSDQSFNLNNSLKFRVTDIVALNTSVPGMSTALGGIYTGTGRGGTTVVAASQAYTGLTNANTALDLTLASGIANTIFNAGTQFYLNLSTPQGGPATADVYVFGETFPT